MPEQIQAEAQAVLGRLERQDAREREEGLPRQQRLRQVTHEVGRFLHVLVLAARPRSIAEIGTSGGYSTIWLASAARSVGAAVTTVEIEPRKVELAASNLHEAGVDDVVTIVEGNAFEVVPRLRSPVDFIFLDAEKEDYLALLGLLVPLLSRGGLLVADNLLSHAEELTPFRERAESDPRLTTLVVPIGRGELLAVRTQ